MAIYETGIEKIQGENYCNVYSNEEKYIKKILAFKEKFPDEVTIIQHIVKGPKDEKCIQAKVPSRWFKFISPPKTMNMSEEHKKKLRENIARAREKKKEQEEEE